MTAKLFWEDPYLTEMNTTVASVIGNDITLEETIFYAFAGGQESDSGSIGDYQVLQARKDGKEIFYTLENDHRLMPGDPVNIKIDWDRRYKLMRLHFAAELVLELTYRKLNSIKKIGAHIAQDKSRIDFEWDGNISTVLPEIENEALHLIEADHEIISAYSDKEAERRYWEIVGFARVSCGGTHLKKTAEVGKIKLKRNNPGKGKERIEIFLSEAA
jgi:Ser-tRNA(Ala) deacylase AlaX